MSGLIHFFGGFLSTVAFMFLMVFALVFLERKVLACFTLRYGPDRAGFKGTLQGLADIIKLFSKEDNCPETSHRFAFWLAPIIVFSSALVLYFLLPLPGSFILLNSEIDLILFVAVASLFIMSFFLAGYAGNNELSVIGAYRAVLSALAYNPPILLCILAVAVLAGSFNLKEIVALQWGGILNWFFIPSFIGFIAFFVSMLARLNRSPFNFSSNQNELAGGYHMEYSGVKYALFYIAECALLFAYTVFFVTLFLGGYLTPFVSWLLPAKFIFLEQFFWLFLKAFLVIFFIILIRASLPLFTIDRFLDISYKVILPFSAVNLIIVLVYKVIRSAQWSF